MKRWSLIVWVVLATAFTACEKVVGEGPVVTETRTVRNFSGIDLRINADVYYVQAPQYSVEVRAQQNILDVLETELVGSRLVVRFENDVHVRRYDRVSVYVSGPDLASLRISGSGNIKTTGLVDTDELEMDISGSGDIEMVDLVAKYLDANISGSGNIEVKSGVVPEERLRISGSGNIELRNVQAQKATTNTSGSGSMRVNVRDLLNITISGSGDVYYKGQPVINLNVSGSGKVKQL